MRIAIALPVFVAVVMVSCTQPAPPTKTGAENVVFTEVDRTTAGVITGSVIFKGKKPAPKKVDMEEDPQCSRLHKAPVFDDPVVVGRDGGSRDAQHPSPGSKQP
jgi:hypothetical protein